MSVNPLLLSYWPCLPGKRLAPPRPPPAPYKPPHPLSSAATKSHYSDLEFPLQECLPHIHQIRHTEEINSQECDRRLSPFRIQTTSETMPSATPTNTAPPVGHLAQTEDEVHVQTLDPRLTAITDDAQPRLLDEPCQKLDHVKLSERSSDGDDHAGRHDRSSQSAISSGTKKWIQRSDISPTAAPAPHWAATFTSAVGKTVQSSKQFLPPRDDGSALLDSDNVAAETEVPKVTPHSSAVVHSADAAVGKHAPCVAAGTETMACVPPNSHDENGPLKDARCIEQSQMVISTPLPSHCEEQVADAAERTESSAKISDPPGRKALSQNRRGARLKALKSLSGNSPFAMLVRKDEADIICLEFPKLAATSSYKQVSQMTAVKSMVLTQIGSKFLTDHDLKFALLEGLVRRMRVVNKYTEEMKRRNQLRAVRTLAGATVWWHECDVIDLV